MKITNDNLNVYNDNDDSLKQMLKKSMIVSLVFLILIISLIIIFPKAITLLICYILGVIVGFALYYFTDKLIKQTYYKMLLAP